jgi:hypothetical protein
MMSCLFTRWFIYVDDRFLFHFSLLSLNFGMSRTIGAPTTFHWGGGGLSLRIYISYV